MKTFVEKLIYIFFLFAVFVVCLFGMAFLRNILGINVGWQLLLILLLAALWQAGERWKGRP